MRRAFAPLALAAALALLAGCGGSPTAAPTTTTPSRPKQPLTLLAAGSPLKTIRAPYRTPRLPREVHVRRGRARLVLRLARRGLHTAIAAAAARGATRLELPLVPVSSSIALRPVHQLLHNDCEATALSMLLAAAGVHAGQLELQEKLPVSEPLDPEPVAGSTLFRWGDPERGFVGRADGGGPEGGFGVYEPPIRALAARYGVHLVDLRGRSLAAVRAAVLAGRPVLAWVGLEPGPYLSWLTPSGREITVNLNEHAIVLVGAGPGYVLVNDPLTGRRVRWSDALFSARWKRLGRRALELPRS
ncbi:MAG TPA: C39 family peptidase [Gaiellaceae bacterium]|jgi:uncharacterized protein YvpB|nr:C39 family peptidase [Gaiellaceae bacterium]